LIPGPGSIRSRSGNRPKKMPKKHDCSGLFLLLLSYKIGSYYNVDMM